MSLEAEDKILGLEERLAYLQKEKDDSEAALKARIEKLEAKLQAAGKMIAALKSGKTVAEEGQSTL